MEAAMEWNLEGGAEKTRLGELFYPDCTNVHVLQVRFAALLTACRAFWHMHPRVNRD